MKKMKEHAPYKLAANESMNSVWAAFAEILPLITEAEHFSVEQYEIRWCAQK